MFIDVHINRLISSDYSDWIISFHPIGTPVTHSQPIEIGELVLMHLSSASPRGGRGLCGGILLQGLYGDFATKFLPLWWGKCGDLDF